METTEITQPTQNEKPDPIDIRKLDKLETTAFASGNSGNLQERMTGIPLLVPRRQQGPCPHVSTHTSQFLERNRHGEHSAASPVRRA